MNRGRGKKDRDNRSNGIEILMSDSFAKINPTDPFILAKQAARRSEIDPIPPLDHFVCLLYRRKRELTRGNEMVSVNHLNFMRRPDDFITGVWVDSRNYGH
jgi:hypothetical protein